MMYYLKNIKNFKYWNAPLKQAFIADMVRKIASILLAIGLYLWLNNTGLLIYIILMIQHYHVSEET